mgnify:FL=1
MPLPPASLRGKRNALVALLTAGFSVAYGLLVGNTVRADRFPPEEFGASAGMLVAAMCGAIALGRLAGGWFAVKDGPQWAERLIRAIVAAPLLAIACAPILDANGDAGLALWLGMVIVAVFFNWQKSIDHAMEGQIGWGPIFGAAIGGLIVTAILASILHVRPWPEQLMFIAAGVAGIASFIVQAAESWGPMTRLRSGTTPTNVDDGRPGGDATAIPPGEWESPRRAAQPAQSEPQAAHQTSRATGATPEAMEWAPYPIGRIPRWAITRMFWGLMAFAFMAGTVVTFIISLVARDMTYHDATAVIIGCSASAAMMLFAFRKTFPFRPIGFWRDSFRPFLISMSLFGIGGTITGIAREWNHNDSDDLFRSHIQVVSRVQQHATARLAEAEQAIAMPRVPKSHRPPRPPETPLAVGEPEPIEVDVDVPRACLNDGARACLISGLVVSSISFLYLNMFTGRRPKSAAPFLTGNARPEAASV